ncbi:glutamate synthase-related protein [Absiella sp. AM54-8XD]|nr:glutamate synthase-related protein [Absiella sp. AM54-8XD]
MKQQLVMTGGFRNSGDMIKALAMGADAIAIASAAMMAIGCQQYRICQNGKCPMGIATQDEELRKRFNIEKGAQCLGNYLHVLCEELKSFARVCGYDDVHKLSKEDLCTTSEEIARYTGIKHC